MRFPAVQKFWKSVKIWQSHRKFKYGNFFETHCIYLYLLTYLLMYDILVFIIFRTIQGTYPLRSLVHLRCLHVTRSTVKTIVSTSAAQCWVGTKRRSFVPERIRRCLSSETKTLTPRFSSSSLTTHTLWYRTDPSGSTRSFVRLITRPIGTGSTGKLQVLTSR